MREKSTSLESDHPSVEPDSVNGVRHPGDVDQMVFSFLSELNTFSDTLELPRDKPAEQNDGVSIPADLPSPVDARPPAPKPVSYRNIDVLLMDNKQSRAGKERTREELPHTTQGLFESQPRARSAGARRRRMRMMRCSAASVTLLGALGLLFYFAAWQSIKTEDIAAPLHTGPPPSLSTAGAPALNPKAVIPAVAIEKVPPRYPEEARRLGVKGTVELDADVDANGKVVRALAVSGPVPLRSAATEALLKWRFKPAQQDGINLKSTARVSVVFDR